MGYYSSFWIKWKFIKDIEICPLCKQSTKSLSETELLKILTDIKGYEGFESTTYEDYMYILNETKWYKWEKHLKEFVTTIPDLLVEIYVEGEENGDIWKARFLNGTMERQNAKIMVPEFTKIKE